MTIFADASALIAIIAGDAEALALADCLEAEPRRRYSTDCSAAPVRHEHAVLGPRKLEALDRPLIVADRLGGAVSHPVISAVQHRGHPGEPKQSPIAPCFYERRLVQELPTRRSPRRFRRSFRRDRVWEVVGAVVVMSGGGRARV